MRADHIRRSVPPPALHEQAIQAMNRAGFSDIHLTETFWCYSKGKFDSRCPTC